jgi:hypothetical protein
MVYKARHRRGPDKYGPLILVILATIFIMAEPLRHVLQDRGLWPSRMRNGMGSAEYRAGCHAENIKCLSPVGILFTIVLTYVGFLFLVVGVLWNANIKQQCLKIRAKWRELRSH